jgi:hypothetical protein
VEGDKDRFAAVETRKEGVLVEIRFEYDDLVSLLQKCSKGGI